MPDAQPKPTAAEVVAKHLDCQWRHGVHLDCGAPLPPAGPDFRSAHVTERLAAAGLLATPEHDAQVRAQALRDAADARDAALLWGSEAPSAWLRVRAARIEAGEPTP